MKKEVKGECVKEIAVAEELEATTSIMDHEWAWAIPFP
jgi:hypothetical protein